MANTTYDITITHGDSYSLPITFADSDSNPIDLSSSTFRAMIRQKYTSAVLTSFSIDTTNAATGVIVLSLTPDQTSALPVTKDDASNVLHYDLEVTYAVDNVQTEIGGTLTLSPEVSY